MKQTILTLTVATFSLAILCTACKKKDDVIPFVPQTIVVALNSNQEIPSNGRTSVGTATIKILENNKLTLAVSINNTVANEVANGLHIHAADAVTNGPIVVGFTITNAVAGEINGEALAVRQSFIDSLKAGVADLYVNVHSPTSPAGIARGQINQKITDAYTVSLTGAAEVPAVSTTATGLAVIRVTNDNKMISKITVSNIETGDALRFAHIHRGAVGVNGAILTNLADVVGDFGITKTLTLDVATVTALRTEALYINVHSNTSPAGKLRGQIR